MRHTCVRAAARPSDTFHEILAEFWAHSIGVHLDARARLRISARDRRNCGWDTIAATHARHPSCSLGWHEVLAAGMRRGRPQGCHSWEFERGCTPTARDDAT